MKSYIPLPPEFAGLEGRVHWVQQINENEFHASCPNCGTESHHNDSNPSDRFVLWLESRYNGKPFGMCIRHCGFKWSPDKSDAVWTPEEKQAFELKRRELNEREEERIREYARTVVMKQNIYRRFMDNLKTSEFGKHYLKKRWFNSEQWNTYWGFGVWEDYLCKGRLGNYYSPAITMPIVGLREIIENVKLRVTEAKDTADRFRNLYKTGNQSIYLPIRANKIGNKVAIFEGEMKACTVQQWASLPNDVQIIATQGMGVGSRMTYALENAEVVYLCLDPDAFVVNEKSKESPIMRVARRIGLERTRIILCKDKVDDAIRGGFNLRNAFNMAVKPSQIQ